MAIGTTVLIGMRACLLMLFLQSLSPRHGFVGYGCGAFVADRNGGPEGLRGGWRDTRTRIAERTEGEGIDGQSTAECHKTTTMRPVHTLILCRHGDSVWNGGEPGCVETFTGWTDVPLSRKGVEEAKDTGRQVSAYTQGIDACFTSVLQRAQMTAHYCLWAFSEMRWGTEPRKYVCDYRLNERHYGALQGYVKRDVESGLYGHDPKDVSMWRRSWHAVPPLLDDADPRRVAETKRFGNYCGGSDRVPRGESLEQVARDRVGPFLREVLTPVLDEASVAKGSGTGLVVAHANSLRALIGVVCRVEEDTKALSKLEALRIQTGVPLVLRFTVLEDGRFQVCDLDGTPHVASSRSAVDGPDPTTNEDGGTGAGTTVGSTVGCVDLPVRPLGSVPVDATRRPAAGTPPLSVGTDPGADDGTPCAGGPTADTAVVAEAGLQNESTDRRTEHGSTSRRGRSGTAVV